jgi:carbonic anhydrase/acetyltransferase-like protein (isoleucine patch superfamily)
MGRVLYRNAVGALKATKDHCELYHKVIIHGHISTRRHVVGKKFIVGNDSQIDGPKIRELVSRHGRHAYHRTKPDY